MNNEKIQKLWDRQKVQDIVIRYAAGIDKRDWEAYRSCFADEVEIDFTSWIGGTPSVFPADRWVELVRRTLGGFTSTQHVSANQKVHIESNEAICVSDMQAEHFLPNDEMEHIYTIGGHYTNSLLRTSGGWKIRKCKLTVTWTSGDRRLFSLASDRFSGRGTEGD